MVSPQRAPNSNSGAFQKLCLWSWGTLPRGTKLCRIGACGGTAKSGRYAHLSYVKSLATKISHQWHLLRRVLEWMSSNVVVSATEASASVGSRRHGRDQRELISIWRTAGSKSR